MKLQICTVCTAPPTPHPAGPMSGGFPPQKANTYLQPEVPTGVLTQPLWHPTPWC